MFVLVPKNMCLIDSVTTYTILKSNKSMVGLLIPKTCLKCGRNIGSKDKTSWMRKGAKMQNDLIEKVEIPKDSFDIINGLAP